MKAVILVGGEGTRLRPLTCNTTKAMVPILNRPFLEHMVGYLKEHGIEDIILAMGYSPNSIQGYFGDGTRFGIKLTCLVEESPLGTAGAVKNAEALLDEPFFVFNGDVLTEIDLTAMMQRHRAVRPKVSIALTPVEDPSIYGVVETDAGGMVKRFVEKPGRDEAVGNMINAGIYILEPDVLENVPAATHFMFEHHLFPLLLERREAVLSYTSDAYWIDIGTPEKYLRVHHDLLMRGGKQAIQLGRGSRIHLTARIEGPMLIGEDCVIAEDTQLKGPTVLGARCEIAKGAVVAGAVLWDGVRIGEGTMISNCILGSNSHVQQGSLVPDNCILGDNVTVNEGKRLAEGTLVWPEGWWQ
jgi:mannose-1-phosphate guanylyltransferase